MKSITLLSGSIDDWHWNISCIVKENGFLRKRYIIHFVDMKDNYQKYHRKNFKLRKYLNEWRRKNKPSHIFSILKTRAKRENIQFSLTKDEFIEWYEKQNKKCFYCQRSIEDINKMDDSINNRTRRLTIDRLDNSKPYELDNIVLACYRCNYIKSDFFSKEEMIEIGKIIRRKYEINNASINNIGI